MLHYHVTLSSHYHYIITFYIMAWAWNWLGLVWLIDDWLTYNMEGLKDNNVGRYHTTSLNYIFMGHNKLIWSSNT